MKFIIEGIEFMKIPTKDDSSKILDFVKQLIN